MPESTEWPEAVEIVNASGASDIVLLCEHASNHVPAEYDGLGLTPADLTRHIAWDPGAAAVTRHLSRLLDAPAYLGTYSRLLIDLNRPLDARSSIVVHSEDTAIPGNVGLDATERQRRAGTIFRPYHDTVSDMLDARQKVGRPTRLVSIHSFTPVYLGVARTWHAGILFDHARDLGETLVARLQTSGHNIGANVPFVSSRDEDYGVPVHGDDRDIPAVLVELRQDLIAGEAGATGWAERLAVALKL